MFQRFHEMKEEREGGFTLIELLVVILIIAILAAIAIPVFLRQREKGWIGQAESALKNAATAQESFLTSTGQYTTVVSGGAGAAPNDLEDEGFKATTGVTVTVPTATGGTAYCIEADHTSLDDASNDFFYSSATGRPQTGECP